MPLHLILLAKLKLLFINTSITFKLNWFVSLLLPILLFFEPITSSLLLIFFAVSIDYISGIIKAKKLKEKITSRRFRDSVSKLFLYESLSGLMYGIEILCFWGIPVSNIIIGFILLTEALSISENVDEISNGKLGISKIVKGLRNKFIKNNK